MNEGGGEGRRTRNGRRVREIEERAQKTDGVWRREGHLSTVALYYNTFVNVGCVETPASPLPHIPLSRAAAGILPLAARPLSRK